MRILFLTHAFNSLTQRLYVALCDSGHEVSVEFDINDSVALEAVELYQPDLIVAPFLKRAIAERIWQNHVCLIVHPGIRGDRGPSALDWAILNEEQRWGVTVLQANAEMDAGDIWACAEFPMRAATKASLYRGEVTDAAVTAVLQAVQRFASGRFKPQALDYADPEIRGSLQALMQQQDRRINWQTDDTNTVLRKIRCADGFPGVRDTLCGRELFLYDAHAEAELHGEPGRLLARCGPALCRATIDGAIWIGHLRDPESDHPFKLPATTVLAQQAESLPEITASENSGYREMWYEEQDRVGYLHFPLYNGAMSTAQCERLRALYCDARQRDTRVIVLCGGDDFWSNGMHLNLIEAASDSAADESWRNINAIDDLAAEIISTTSHVTISALRGNAGAGGVFLARAADYVWASAAVILNPHYRDMGNLYGSEFWTYLLPTYAGAEKAETISKARLPMGAPEGLAVGLIDQVFAESRQAFQQQIELQAQKVAASPDFEQQLAAKQTRRRDDEAARPLSSYRDSELEQMKMNFYGFDPSYHVARFNFVYKVPKSRTPLTIANHRRTRQVEAKRKLP